LITFDSQSSQNRLSDYCEYTNDSGMPRMKLRKKCWCSFERKPSASRNSSLHPSNDGHDSRFGSVRISKISGNTRQTKTISPAPKIFLRSRRRQPLHPPPPSRKRTSTVAMTAGNKRFGRRKFASEPSSFSSSRSRMAARARCRRTRNAVSEIPSVAAASAPPLPSR